MQKTTVLVAIASIAVVGCFYFFVTSVDTSRSAKEVGAQLQQARQQLEALRKSNESHNDSVRAFEDGYRVRLQRTKASLDIYSKVDSEANKQQVQRDVADLALFVHSWQQLISAMVPMFDSAIPQIIATGNTGDAARVAQLLATLQRAADESQPVLNQGIDNLNKLQSVNGADHHS